MEDVEDGDVEDVEDVGVGNVGDVEDVDVEDVEDIEDVGVGNVGDVEDVDVEDVEDIEDGQEISGSLRATPGGNRPMDQKMKSLMYDPRVTLHLLPLPKGVAKSQDTGGSTADKNDADPKPNPKPKKKAKASPKAKAKCPEELKSFSQFDSNNQPICWSYNLSGCKEAVQNLSEC